MNLLRTAASAYSNVLSDPAWPAYEVVETTKSYEKRRYQPFTTITYTFSAKTGDEPVMSNLWKLVKYTQGENADGKVFKMYLPIMVKVRPSFSGEKENQFTLMLVLDKQVTSANPPPRSTIEGVFPISHPGGIYYARRFNGFAKEADWKRESAAILDVCQGLPINVEEVISATYDMPTKLLNRRNEVLVAERTENASSNENEPVTA